MTKCSECSFTTEEDGEEGWRTTGGRLLLIDVSLRTNDVYKRLESGRK